MKLKAKVEGESKTEPAEVRVVGIELGLMDAIELIFTLMIGAIPAGIVALLFTMVCGTVLMGAFGQVAGIFHH